MESKTVSVTLRVVPPVIPPAEAVIHVSPAATVYAIPVSSIVATPGVLEAQATVLVRTCVVESL
jgi:hypothetical protein